MTLTKEDLKAIEKISEKTAERIINPRIEELAVMTAKQFSVIDKRFDRHDKNFLSISDHFKQIDKRFDQVDKRFKQVDERFGQIDIKLDHINIRLEVIETDLADLKKLHNEVRMIRELLDEVVTFEQHNKLAERVLRIEKHLGLGLAK